MKTILAVAAVGLIAANAAIAHPTLPTDWTAIVDEDEVGTVLESYRMVYKPSPTNPSGKWTNFTDGSCQRLILDDDLAHEGRYLLHCDAVDCCIEQQSGNHIEYQIPNVHPCLKALGCEVEYAGKETITQTFGDKTVTVNADVYTWGFELSKFFSFVTGGGDSGVAQLHRWSVQVEGQNFTNEYANYTQVPTADLPAFISTFQVPPQCQGAISCDNAHAKGLLSAKNLAFAKAKSAPIVPPTSATPKVQATLI
jgi:hypothetical protein